MRIWERLRALRNRPDEDPERPIPYVDPLRAGRHPFQTYMLGLCIVSGLPYLFGKATAEAVEQHLPVYLALAWGLALLLGASVALVGSYWNRSIADALTMERVGLSITGGAALVYALCVLGARSAIGPLYVVTAYFGYYLLAVPVPQDKWGPGRTRRVEDLLTVLGLIVITASLTLLIFSPGRVVLVGVAIILGFGFSCLRRAKDIGRIFHRANELVSPKVLRETEE
jgi:hypothetical protein